MRYRTRRGRSWIADGLDDCLKQNIIAGLHLTEGGVSRASNKKHKTNPMQPLKVNSHLGKHGLALFFLPSPTSISMLRGLVMI